MNALRSRRHSSAHTAKYRHRDDAVASKVVVKKTATAPAPQPPIVSQEELAYIFSLF
ncbi:hypothetical protein [Shewanella dokdonensis]|uniref:hypothetical protein n=1 Tax=Shewanella dokdonensis TaxID=712036 RepID=UPI00200BDFF1|nr:hypothetical protein [Shewanella dokdonensis]MCL1073676.1 hypothetical protein [Shewanella dokdonensis]